MKRLAQHLSAMMTVLVMCFIAVGTVEAEEVKIGTGWVEPRIIVWSEKPSVIMPLKNDWLNPGIVISVEDDSVTEPFDNSWTETEIIAPSPPLLKPDPYIGFSKLLDSCFDRVNDTVAFVDCMDALQNTFEADKTSSE